MTNNQMTEVLAALLTAMKAQSAQKPARKERTYTKKLVVDDKQDRQLTKLTAISRGFARRGIKITFDQATGRFDNVKPYRLWALEGRQVRKGEHGVRGFFHISQTDVMPKMPKVGVTDHSKPVLHLPVKQVADTVSA